jgi:hypothetical protein
MNDNLTTFVYRLPGNLGTSTYWNSQGLSRAVQRLLYLFMAPRLTRLIAKISPRRPGRNGTGTGFSPSILFSPDSIIPPLLYTHLHLLIALASRTNDRSI